MEKLALNFPHLVKHQASRKLCLWQPFEIPGPAQAKYNNQVLRHLSLRRAQKSRKAGLGGKLGPFSLGTGVTTPVRLHLQLVLIKAAQEIIKPSTYKSNTQSVVGLLRRRLQIPFQ